MSDKSVSKRKSNFLPVSEIPGLIKDTFVEFFQKEGLFHGAALAYYTIFALVPLLYLCLSYFGRIIGQELMLDIISDLLQNKVGIQDISGIMEFMKDVDFEKGNIFLELISVVVLLLVCSAFVVSLKYSINEFFDVHVKFASKKQALIKTVVFRLLSIAFVGIITFFVIAIYFAQTVMIAVSDKFFEENEAINWFFDAVVQHGLALFSNLIIFMLIFKYLHDGFVSWKLAMGGALVTAVLLYLGQLLIKFYLFNYFYLASGGFAGTLFIMLAWVYYSSQIIFFGAKFTNVYARKIGKPIQAKAGVAKSDPLIQ